MERILREQRSLLQESLAACAGPSTAVQAQSLVSALGVVYVHVKTSDGGDLYLTRYGVPLAGHLDVQNWHERKWFTAHRERLAGTSCVYRVPTRAVDGTSLQLVVKTCRVGEDVPIATHTLQEFISTEFNSPWEEFALVMEMRDGAFGPSDIRIRTQEPLAIYVPPGKMQKWQTGRSKAKINRIRARHPGIDLDILRQYILIYRWIDGRDIVQEFQGLDLAAAAFKSCLTTVTEKAMEDMKRKGYIMADMKPVHIIIGDTDRPAATNGGGRRALLDLMKRGRYAVVDYELLIRTSDHEQQVKAARRYHYLDDQRNRMEPTPLPLHLREAEVLGVPYIYGHVESTDGGLWVVGRNGRLFDYFLPERWRKTSGWKLSAGNEVYYALTKDNVHVVWKTSRVGELPHDPNDPAWTRKARAAGFNSPFEEAAIAAALDAAGIPTVYLRAIYRAGTRKIERSEDRRRYNAHRKYRNPEGEPVLQARHNYITIWGYFNGSDDRVPGQEGRLLKPVDLQQALCTGLIEADLFLRLTRQTQQRLRRAGYDGSLLKGNDLLIALEPDGRPFCRNGAADPEVRLCNLSLVVPASRSKSSAA